MNRFGNKKFIMLVLLMPVAVYIFLAKLIPSVNNYYSLEKIYIKKKDAEKGIKVRLNGVKNIKSVRFRAGRHRFSTYLISILSYINYLCKSGCYIKVKILDNKNFKESFITKNNFQVSPEFSKKLANKIIVPKKELPIEGLPYKSKILAITFDNVSNIGILFQLLKTLRSFPVIIKKIYVKSGKNASGFIYIRLIDLNNVYRSNNIG